MTHGCSHYKLHDQLFLHCGFSSSVIRPWIERDLKVHQKDHYFYLIHQLEVAESVIRPEVLPSYCTAPTQFRILGKQFCYENQDFDQGISQQSNVYG